MNNVAVRAHALSSTLAAIEVASPGCLVGVALATAVHAWPERACWIREAFDRGDFVSTRSGVWFFDGPAGEALALGE